MQIHFKNKYIDEKAEVQFSRYFADQSIAIQLVGVEFPEPLSKPTVCLFDYGYRPLPEEVFIANANQYEGSFECLVKEGVLVDTGKRLNYGRGDSHVRVGTLTPAAKAEFDKQTADT